MRKPKKRTKIRLEDFTFRYYFMKLNPTEHQFEQIKKYGELMSRIHVWAHEYILAPSHKRHVERTHSFCTSTLKMAVNDPCAKDISVEDKLAIQAFGIDGFNSLLKMAAYEHSKLPFGVERFNSWVEENMTNNKFCIFLTAMGELGFFPSYNKDQTMKYISTNEFGEIPIDHRYENRYDAIMNITDPKVYLYPQIIYDDKTLDCYVRFVVATYDDNIVSIPPQEAYVQCQYVNNPDMFFSDYMGYLYWPIF